MGFPLPWPHGYIPSETEVEGTSLAYRTDVLEVGRTRLLHQFKGKPRIEALLGVTLGPFQELWIAVWQLMVERRIDTATTEALRVLARTVGIRGFDSAADGLLRRYVRAAILAARSSGTREDLIAVTRAFSGSDSITLRDYYPAAVTVILVAELDADGFEAWLLAKLLRKAASAGVRLHFEFVTTDPEETFRFSTSNTLDEASDENGFGDDDETVGGLFAGGFNGE